MSVEQPPHPVHALTTCELGGGVFNSVKAPSSELLGVAFAIMILVIAFGSVLAMGLPLGVAAAEDIIADRKLRIARHL